MRVADFLDEPHIAVIKALSLEFQPTFLDILPLYIVMLVIFPVILLGMQRHWLWVLVSSAIVYLAVQVFDISVSAYPEGHVWYFNPLAWQFLFVAGAVLGNRSSQGREGLEGLPGFVFWAAAAVFFAALAVKLSWTVHGVWDWVPGFFLKTLWPVNKNN